MRSEPLLWLVTLVGVVVFVASIAAGHVTAGVVVFAAIGFLVVTVVGQRLAVDSDRAWFPAMLQVAFLVKVAGILARYYAVTVIYRTGDAFSYHEAGGELAHFWRDLQVPVTIGRSAGTRFTEIVTSLLYAPGVPTMMGGFLIFGFLSFAGVVFFYLAFRRSTPSRLHKPYALAVFFLPSLVFWPTAIGKDALMVLALGAAALGAAIVYGGSYARGLPLIAGGLALATGVRAHVATMMAAGVVLGFILWKRSARSTGAFGRLVVTAAAVIALFALGSVAAKSLGFGQDVQTLEDFLGETERRTAQGGSAVSGSPVSSPIDIPEATLRVLFRPLPYEAADAPTFLSSLEGAALLFLVLLRFPTMLRNLRYVRRYPYLLLAIGFSGAFIVAFSSIFNLGILARQRSQVLPFVLAVLIGLGWTRLKSPLAKGSDEQLESEHTAMVAI